MILVSVQNVNGLCGKVIGLWQQVEMTSEFYLKVTVNARKTQFFSFEQSINSGTVDVGVNGGSSLFKMLGLSFTSNFTSLHYPFLKLDL